MSSRKQFTKGEIVEVNCSTTMQRWTDARYLGTTSSKGELRHAAMVLTDGGPEWRITVPSRRIRAKTATWNAFIDMWAWIGCGSSSHLSGNCNCGAHGDDE